MTTTLTIIRGCPGDGKTSLAKVAGMGVAIAADDYPNLYIDGVYQAHLQKESHEWCKDQVRYHLSQGRDVVVHNTFARLFYLDAYTEIAKELNCAVHVVTSEGVILPSSNRTQSIHNVPESVVQRMRSQWEPLNPIPKRGITLIEIAEQMQDLKRPDVLIFDMDGTLRLTKSGDTFARSPDDFMIHPEIKRWAKIKNRSGCELPIHVVSNQRGIGTGQKQEDFLEEEIDNLDDALLGLEIEIASAHFAVEENTSDAIFWGSSQWEKIKLGAIADKPNTGMFNNILQENMNFLRIGVKAFWIMGDAHTDNHPEDWEFAKNCRQAYPDLDIRYVPIEMLNIFWEYCK